MIPTKQTTSQFYTLLLCTTAIIFSASNIAIAGPEGGLTINGSANVESTNSNTTITQSTERAIIKWDSFDVQGHEHVDFIQPSSSSITVNRIQDIKPSQIDGSITANGNIMLLNSNGVVFGAESQIDVGGIIASTSDLKDDLAFMAGGAVKLTKLGKADAKIINHGTIKTAPGGLAGFVAPNVENHGIIQAKLGRVQLSSGDMATIDFTGDGLIQIAVSGDVEKQLVKNTGILDAQGGTVAMTAAVARGLVENLLVNDGTIKTNTTSSGKKGHVYIQGVDSTVKNIGTIEANGDIIQDGGHIVVDAKFAALGGRIEATGKHGGTIAVKAHVTSLADKIEAKGINGKGGSIVVESAKDTWETSTARLNVDGLTDGGNIRSVTAENLVTSGQYSARGQNGAGGKVDITGGGVKMLSAQVDASGSTKGGIIRVGGEFQGGKNLSEDELLNAQITTLDKSTKLTADGTGDHADGGTVIVWSDEDTLTLGGISATPGLSTGQGGFVEVSSSGKLSYSGDIQTGRDNRPGHVLLDPKNITISDGSFDPSYILLGRGYTTENTIRLDAADSHSFAMFNNGFSLNGNRMVVGNAHDDGFEDSRPDAGAAYLYSFTDSSFSGGVLEGIIGAGYTGGKNIDLSGHLDSQDFFGWSVSLDGNSLSVGALLDDGRLNNRYNSGAVYNFTFADDVFTGGNLESRMGWDYGALGGGNIDVSLDAHDRFGASLSLDNERLAVGARLDDGQGNVLANVGAVYLFSFADSDFTNPTLESTIGYGYTGNKNYDLSNYLQSSDKFAHDLSLSNNSLIVNAPLDDGKDNSVSNVGAVYMISFVDSTFSGGTLEGIIGQGYNFDNSIDMSAYLQQKDHFGNGVSLDNNRIAIGAHGDDASNDSKLNSGAVYLYSFADETFNGATLESIIGNNYETLGGKNISRPHEANTKDTFGIALSLDANRLIVSASGDDGPVGNLNSDAGALHFYSFSDSVFSNGTYEGTLGVSYTGGKNIAQHFNSASDLRSRIFGMAIDGTRVAIGFPYGDGLNNQYGDMGEVRLYNFADMNFDSITLEGAIGAGYTGGKNIDLSGHLDNQDFFGGSVSLDGNSLSVGALLDDGRLNNRPNSGAVYNFTFADDVFTGGNLESRMGWDYGALGGGNINVSLDGNNHFGSALSLDNERLAVGARNDDGQGNVRSNSGAVYLFSFADSDFTNPTLESTIGYGYTGNKNYDLSTLDAADYFGSYSSISLDGNRLVVGSSHGDGFGNSALNSGEVYMFTFADEIFSAPTLQGTIGVGYTGGKNVDMSGIVENNDVFSSVALNYKTLAVGSPLDNGGDNSTEDTGAVHLLNFSDLEFGGGNYDYSIGYRYFGGKNVHTPINANDYLGTVLDIHSGNLIIGAAGGDGFNNAFDGSGEALIFKGNSNILSEGFSFNNLPSTSIEITPADIVNLLNNPQDVTLQASNDIFVNAEISANNIRGDAGSLTIQAGRSIAINADITTDNGDLNLYANEDLATGIVDERRDTGAAEITMAPDTIIHAGTGSVHIRLDDGTGKTNRESGDVTLETITADNVLVHSIGQKSDIVINDVITSTGAGDAMIIASGRDFINNHGAGALVTPSGRWLVYSDAKAFDTQNGLVADFEVNECVYLGACPGLEANNGFLYQYPSSVLRITLNTDRFYGTANPDNATLQSLFTYIGFEGADDASVLDSLPTVSIAPSANAHANAGTKHKITLSGGADDVYTYSLDSDNFLTITKKPVTATLVNNVSKQYSDSNLVLNNSHFTFAGFENGETFVDVHPVSHTDYGSIDGTTSAGSYNFGITFDEEANYTITAADGTLDILKRDITASWTGDLNKIYGNANPTVTTAHFDYIGLVNGDTGAAITASGNFGDIDQTTNSGTYNNAVIGNFNAANYNITNIPITDLVIAKRDITATVQDQSRAYGNANPNLNYTNVTWNNLVNGETGAALNMFDFDFTTSLATSNAGTTHDINLTNFSDNNYNLVGTIAGQLNIIKAPLTVNINSFKRQKNQPNPVFTYTLEGLKNGDDFESVLSDLTLSSIATDISPPGLYDITGAGGVVTNNYFVDTINDGQLTILTPPIPPQLNQIPSTVEQDLTNMSNKTTNSQIRFNVESSDSINSGSLSKNIQNNSSFTDFSIISDKAEGRGHFLIYITENLKKSLKQTVNVLYEADG